MTAAPPGTPPGPAGYPDPAGHGAGQGWGEPLPDPLTAPLPPGTPGGGYGYPGGAGRQQWYDDGSYGSPQGPPGGYDPYGGDPYTPGEHETPGGQGVPGGHDTPGGQGVPGGHDTPGGQQQGYGAPGDGYAPGYAPQGPYGTGYAPGAPAVPTPPAPAPGPGYDAFEEPEPYGDPDTGDAFRDESLGGHDRGYDRGYDGGGAAGEDEDGAEDGPPVTGGRAERRKAARRGGGRRRSAPVAGTAAQEPGESAAPVSRVEARRAAKAARVSPGVMVSQVVGELFITLGVLMLLFVVYQLWYTNVLADEQTSGATNTLQNQWASDTKDSSDAGEPSSFPHGTDFAIIYIPKLDVKAPIAEGTDKDSILDKGDVGHYDGAMETAMPWAKSGNFALAGHRNTHGEPFRYINQLVAGDKVVVETKGMYYTYAVTSMLPSTSPSNVAVIQPVPQGSGYTGPGRYITLTTCTPEFTSEFRLIVWGKMIAEQPRTKGLPPALLGG